MYALFFSSIYFVCCFCFFFSRLCDRLVMQQPLSLLPTICLGTMNGSANKNAMLAIDGLPSLWYINWCDLILWGNVLPFHPIRNGPVQKADEMKILKQTFKVFVLKKWQRSRCNSLKHQTDWRRRWPKSYKPYRIIVAFNFMDHFRKLLLCFQWLSSNIDTKKKTKICFVFVHLVRLRAVYWRGSFPINYLTLKLPSHTKLPTTLTNSIDRSLVHFWLLLWCCRTKHNKMNIDATTRVQTTKRTTHRSQNI